MKITGIYADNFLSFKDFRLSILDPKLNIFVGPNGSGKSNLLYVVEQVIEALDANFSTVEFRSDCNFTDTNDTALIALDLEFDREIEHSLLAHYIVYSLFQRDGIQNLINTGSNQAKQINHDRLRTFVDQLYEKVVRDPDLQAVYAGQLCVTLENTLSPSLVVYYTFRVGNRDYFWYLYGAFNSCLGSRLRDRSGSWLSSDLWKEWMACQGESELASIRDWLSGESNHMPEIGFDFSSVLDRVHDTTLISMGGMNDFMGNGPEVPSFAFLRRKLEKMNDPTTPIQSRTVFQYLLQDSVIKTSNIHIESRLTFKYTEWESPESLLLDGSGLALHLLRLKNGTKPEREEFAKISNTFSSLANGRRLDVRIRAILDHTLDPMYRSPRYPVRGHRPVVLTQSTPSQPNPLLQLEILVIDTRGREFPIARSGAGMVELAFLSAVLSLSRSHVVLLDEPGTHAHAGVQRHIARMLGQVSAQILLVTHSPYLLSSSTLTNTRRVHLVNGMSVISEPYRLPPGKSLQLKVEQAFDRSPNRANMLFSNLVLLVDGESELHALPIWFSEFTKSYGLEEYNITLESVSGKKNYPSYLRFLKAFNIPWMILCDGDSLGEQDNICKQLKEIGIRIPDSMNFAETKLELKSHNVFVIGDNVNCNFETIAKVTLLLDSAKEQVGSSKAHQAQLIAEHSSCADELVEFFKVAIRLSQNVYAMNNDSDSIAMPLQEDI